MPSKLFIAQFVLFDIKSRSCFDNTEVHSPLSVSVILRLNRQNEAFNRFLVTVVHVIRGYIDGRQQNGGKISYF